MTEADNSHAKLRRADWAWQTTINIPLRWTIKVIWYNLNTFKTNTKRIKDKLWNKHDLIKSAISGRHETLLVGYEAVSRTEQNRTTFACELTETSSSEVLNPELSQTWLTSSGLCSSERGCEGLKWYIQYMNVLIYILTKRKECAWTQTGTHSFRRIKRKITYCFKRLVLFD